MKTYQSPSEKDYLEAIKMLLRNSRMFKDNPINIKACNWILPITKELANMGAAVKFWRNTIVQLRLHRVFGCKCVYDLCYSNDYTLFTWERTDEGSKFWNDIFVRLERKYPNDFVYYGWY